MQRINALPPGDVVLIGSSLGGFVAIEAAARQAEPRRIPITHLVLLAPAVELEWEKWSELAIGRHRGLAERRARSTCFTMRSTSHAAAIRVLRRRGSLRRVARRRLSQPMLIFQGRHDESVSPAAVERFAAAQPRASLHMLEDGHQLKNSLEFIWQKTAAALGL